MPIQVLIVEDEELYADQLEIILDKLNYKHLATVDNGIEALALIDEIIPDLILMDVNIQGDVNGIQLAGIIHQKFQIPIIFITSLQDEDTFSKALETRPVDFLLKPFNEVQLQRSVSLCVQKILNDHDVAKEASQNNEQKLASLRQKISADLHDDVGSLLSSLAWQSNALGLEANDELQAKLDRIANLSRRAMERMRDTVWAMDTRNDNLGSLTLRMKDYLVEVFSQQKMKYEFSYDSFEENEPIDQEIKQQVYLIFTEIITNSLKHSNGDIVWIQIIREEDSLHLLIKDNGQVDPTAIKKSGLGLSNIKMRAKKINANFTESWQAGWESKLVFKRSIT